MTDESRKDWRRQFISAEPSLLVTDIEQSRDYFFRCLHFYCEGYTYKEEQRHYCQMFRGAAAFGLYQAAKPHAFSRCVDHIPDGFYDLILWVANLDEYLAEIRPDNPIIIREPYVDTGIKTMVVGSPDEHRICLIEDQWRDDSWPPKSAT